MPTRLFREGFIDSEQVDQLTTTGEIFFVRLILKADDYGRYHAHQGLLRAALYPLKLNTIREADITRWIAECEKAGLIALYGGTDGRRYLVILKFNQRVRAKKAKFPDPPPEVVGRMTVTCQSNARLDGDDNEDVDEGEAEVYTHTGSSFAEIPSWDEVKAYADRIGLAEWRAQDWFNEMEGVGWMIKRQRVRKWRSIMDTIKTWWESDGRPMERPKGRNAPREKQKAESNQIQEKISVKTIKV
jgi:hypothetical protein